jgi:hypothetical protein
MVKDLEHGNNATRASRRAKAQRFHARSRAHSA